ncbi:MAG TPA: response regulator [Desulfobulbus sp.]|nr:response regulator [Desulfobulbus sp.]
MILPWWPVRITDVTGSMLTLALSILCFRIAVNWRKNNQENLFCQYVFMLTSFLVLFAVSRSVGHLVKQILLARGLATTWHHIAPYTGAINTASFIIIFTLGIYFSRMQRVHEQVDDYKNNLEALVRKRTRELHTVNENLKQEIRKRHDVERNLAGSLQFQQELTSTIPVPFYYKDCRGTIIGCNRSFEYFFNLRHEEIIGQTFADLVSPELADLEHEKDRHLLAEPGLQIYEARIIGTGTAPRQVVFHRAPFFDVDGRINGIIGVLLDLTDVKEAELARTAAERQLQKAKRMEAIGLMAGGVAHDLNNILSGIVSYPELLLMGMDEDNELRKPLEAIRRSGQRAAAVVADLLTVARGVASTRSVRSLNSLATEYLESPEFSNLRRERPEIRFDILLAPDSGRICCSAIHINKCLMNLVTNAVEAVGQRGRIVIATRRREIGQKTAAELGVEPGTFGVLSISDSGPGIPENDREHIFEPFYSTKVMGKSGTGLGLTVVWNTVQDHDGAILVDSNEGGTTFALYFPLTREEEEKEKNKVGFCDLQGRGELILVVDDDPLQRDIATQMLVLLGYRVEAAASGEEAVAFMRNQSADLVLLDMIMEPGLGGLETYLQILALHPGQKAVIASGYSQTEDIRKTMELGAGGYIRKPYTMEELAMAVGEELKKPQTG